MYKPEEIEVDIENPYDEGAEFLVSIVESMTRNGIVKNPFLRKPNEVDDLEDYQEPKISYTEQQTALQNSPLKTSFKSINDYSSPRMRKYACESGSSSLK